MTTVLGFKISMPIMVAPTSMKNTFQIYSHQFNLIIQSSMEEVASTTPGLRLLRLHASSIFVEVVYNNRNVVRRAGLKAVALSVDTPCLGVVYPILRTSIYKDWQEFLHGLQIFI